MSKYKIHEFRDGNGLSWYRIAVKKWFGFCGWYKPSGSYFAPFYGSVEAADKAIKTIEYAERASRIDYVGPVEVVKPAAAKTKKPKKP